MAFNTTAFNILDIVDIVQEARTTKSEMHFCFKMIQFWYVLIYFDEFKTFLPSGNFKNVAPLRYFVAKF